MYHIPVYESSIATFIEHLLSRNSEDELSLSEYCNSDYETAGFQEETQRSKNSFQTFKCDICDKFLASKDSLKRHKEIHSEGHKDKFTCNVCDNKFSSQGNLTKHKKLHTGENLLKEQQMYYCDFCEYSSSRSGNLERHKKIHTAQHLPKEEKSKGEKKFSCHLCGFATLYAYNLKVHANIHNKEPSDQIYSCDKCDRTFDRQDNLKRHEFAAHIKEKKDKQERYTCDICNKTFTKKCNLRKHEKLHAGENLLKKEKYFSCDLCDFTTSYSYNLEKHKNIHNADPTQQKIDREKKFSCKLCDYSTYNISNLKRHEKVHIEKESLNESYPCDLCIRSFTWRDNLTRHKKLEHTNETQSENFTCDKCNKIFNRKDNLTRHKYVIHSAKKPDERIACDICNKISKTKECLKRHKWTQHGAIKQDNFTGKIYPCDKCDRFFETEENLKRHQWASHIKKKNPGKVFTCDNCDQTFSAKLALKNHRKVFHIEALTCQLCHIIFPSIRCFNFHMKAHEGKHQCDKCKKRFANRKVLKKHLNSKKNIHCENITYYSCHICQFINLKGKEKLDQHIKEFHSLDDDKSTVKLIANPRKLKGKKSSSFELQDPLAIENEFSCDICMKSYNTRQSFLQHYKTQFHKTRQDNGTVKVESVKSEPLDIKPNIHEIDEVVDDKSNLNLVLDNNCQSNDDNLEGEIETKPDIHANEITDMDFPDDNINDEN